MQRNAVVLRPRRSFAWFLAGALALAGCRDDAVDPRDVYPLVDARSSELLAEVEEAIGIANAALSVDGAFVLVPTWRNAPHRRGAREVPVYFLRNKTPRSVADVQARLEAFRRGWDNLPDMTADLQACAETDPCAAKMYVGMARLTQDVYQSMSAVDSAATEIDCRCVILIEDELMIFRLIIGPSVTEGTDIVPLSWFVPWYALHEVGHRDKSFVLRPHAAWSDAYQRTLKGLNELQIEEMRADAFAAATLGRACFGSDAEVKAVVAQACLGLAIQNVNQWLYSIFDKTQEGLTRQYLRDGAKHPNWLMRLLAMNVVMTDGMAKAVSMLTDFMDRRELFAERFRVQPER